MSRSMKIYLSIILGSIILIIFIDMSAVEQVNWNPTYSLDTKNPFDLYVFNHEVDKIFPVGKFERSTDTPYEYCTKQSHLVNMLFIGKDIGSDMLDSLILKQVA